MKVKLDAVTINEQELPEGNPGGCFQCDSLFSVVISADGLSGDV